MDSVTTHMFQMKAGVFLLSFTLPKMQCETTKGDLGKEIYSYKGVGCVHILTATRCTDGALISTDIHPPCQSLSKEPVVPGGAISVHTCLYSELFCL